MHQLPDFSVVQLFKFFTDDCNIGRFSDTNGRNTVGASGACRFFRVMMWPTKKSEKHVFLIPSHHQTLLCISKLNQDYRTENKLNFCIRCYIK